MSSCKAIDYTDDQGGCLFTATVHCKQVAELDLADKDAITVAGLSGHGDPISDLLSKEAAA